MIINIRNEINKSFFFIISSLHPLEVVQLWESHDLCIEGNKTISTKNRCKYFNQNCHECLMEEASHELEHDNIDFKLVNSIIDEQGPMLKKTRK